MQAWGTGKTEHFYQLKPESILAAIDKLGLKTTGRVLALNSLENRVYEVEIENDQAKSPSEHFVIAKFYRPGRWSKEQIQEEHDFLFDLIDNELPAIAPIKFSSESLFETSDSEDKKLYYCLFPKKGGRNPDELDEVQLMRLARLLARVHRVGKTKSFNHRVTLDVQTYGKNNLEALLLEDVIPDHFKQSYETLANQFNQTIEPLFKNVQAQRIHGDCHWGNILFNEKDGFFFIDFDDVVTGPIIQDFWLICPGRDEHALKNRQTFIEAYNQWNEFPHSQLKLIEPLRGLRYLHFDNWIAKRWSDPAFQQAFAHFKEERHWAERINDLREMISLAQTASQNSYYDPYSY